MEKWLVAFRPLGLLVRLMKYEANNGMKNVVKAHVKAGPQNEAVKSKKRSGSETACGLVWRRPMAGIVNA